MNTVTENVRYLLWKEGISPTEWASRLAQWARCDVQRAEEILQGGALRPSEQTAIANATHCSEEELQLARLVEGVDILQENFKFLVTGFEHGRAKKFAEHIQVKPVTVSRWANKSQKPQKRVFPAVCRYFELPEGTDLEEDALFLLPYPDNDKQRRTWLQQRIEHLSPTALRELFPALQRLLKES
jgi:transcriptional regulator with XRE-family HTH domain